MQAMDKERDEQMEHMLKLKSQARTHAITVIAYARGLRSGRRAHCVA
jgi:hypothetical protein